MPNANKCKGDRFERAAVLTAQEYFPEAWRTRAGWDDDRGDVILVKDYSAIQQAKDCQSRPYWNWLTELDTQKRNAGARFGCVVAKRPGFPDAGEAMAVMRNRDWLALVQHVKALEFALSRYQNGQPVISASRIPVITATGGNANGALVEPSLPHMRGTDQGEPTLPGL